MTDRHVLYDQQRCSPSPYLLLPLNMDFAFRVNPHSGITYTYIPYKAIKEYDLHKDFEILTAASRLNALTMIKVAGSGHVGSSFSAMDLVLGSRLYLQDFSDSFFFSSKGHDAPAIYAIGHLFGEISDQELFMLRRLDGLPGHPEIGVPNVPTNTGSLGMGISKAKGFIYGSRAQNKSEPKVITILGDGELQEGQIWESLVGASRDNLNSLIAIIDGNKLQSDSWVENIDPINSLKKRFEGFGWNYLEIDGHSKNEIIEALSFSEQSEGPTAIYAHTVKGRGITFMESFSRKGLFYKYHSGAPSDEDYLRSVAELQFKINMLENPIERDSNQGFYVKTNGDNNLDNLPKVRLDSLVETWNQLLFSEMRRNPTVVVMDADLSYDTGTYGLNLEFPKRYIQFGIAEQDMVSVAGTIALSGLLPIVHSFASFLTTRSLEQIFNNTTESSTIIYVGFLAGIVPSAPGHSHQAVIDVGTMSSIPGITIYEPSCKVELEHCLKLAISLPSPSYIRITSVGTVSPLETIDTKSTIQSRYCGRDFAIVASGVTMTLLALDVAKDFGNSCAVFSRYCINLDLNEEDVRILSRFEQVLCLENYTPCNANFSSIQRSLSIHGVRVLRYGVDYIPRNGQNEEVLAHHKLDKDSFSGFIRDNIKTSRFDRL